MLKIRLRRMGARNRPFFRLVLSDSRRVPKASAVEELGHYDPTRQPAELKVDRERVQYWVARGAQVSETVKALLAGG
jgi:small subunit ribosomal protein S16